MATAKVAKRLLIRTAARSQEGLVEKLETAKRRAIDVALQKRLKGKLPGIPVKQIEPDLPETKVPTPTPSESAVQQQLAPFITEEGNIDIIKMSKELGDEKTIELLSKAGVKITAGELKSARVYSQLSPYITADSTIDIVKVAKELGDEKAALLLQSAGSDFTANIIKFMRVSTAKASESEEVIQLAASLAGVSVDTVKEVIALVLGEKTRRRGSRGVRIYKSLAEAKEQIVSDIFKNFNITDVVSYMRLQDTSAFKPGQTGQELNQLFARTLGDEWKAVYNAALKEAKKVPWTHQRPNPRDTAQTAVDEWKSELLNALSPEARTWYDTQTAEYDKIMADCDTEYAIEKQKLKERYGDDPEKWTLKRQQLKAKIYPDWSSTSQSAERAAEKTFAK